MRKIQQFFRKGAQSPQEDLLREISGCASRLNDLEGQKRKAAHPPRQ